MKTHTLQAAEIYLHQIQRDRGPLFVGYQGQRMQRAGLAKRVHLIGEAVGIQGLSPHDLRHFWTEDALADEAGYQRWISMGQIGLAGFAVAAVVVVGVVVWSAWK